MPGNKSSGNLNPQVTPSSPEDREELDEALGSGCCSWVQGAPEAWEHRIWGSGAEAIGQKAFEVKCLFLMHSCIALLNLSNVTIDI